MRTLLLLGIAAIAAADDAPVRKMMPKDQAAFYEAIEKNWGDRKAAKEETNDLKKREGLEKADRDYQRIIADITRAVQTNGLKGWVGTLDTKSRAARLPGPAFAVVTKHIYMHITYDGIGETEKNLIRGSSNGDIVTIDITADKRLEFREVSKNVEVIIPGRLLKSLTIPNK